MSGSLGNAVRPGGTRKGARVPATVGTGAGAVGLDQTFTTQLQGIDEVPKPFGCALRDRIPAEDPARMLVFAPAYTSAGVRSPEARPLVAAFVFSFTNPTC